MADLMHYEEFLARGAQACTLQALDGYVTVAPPLPARLTEVSTRLEQHGFEQFSVLFEIDVEGPAAQGMYRLAFADGAASQDLFLVPVARSGTITTYQAVFNRSVDAAPAA